MLVISLSVIFLILDGCSGSRKPCAVIIDSSSGSNQLKLFPNPGDESYSAILVCGSLDPVLVGKFYYCLLDGSETVKMLFRRCGTELASSTTVLPLLGLVGRGAITYSYAATPSPENPHMTTYRPELMTSSSGSDVVTQTQTMKRISEPTVVTEYFEPDTTTIAPTAEPETVPVKTRAVIRTEPAVRPRRAITQ
jgi:hypothetical protein